MTDQYQLLEVMEVTENTLICYNDIVVVSQNFQPSSKYHSLGLR